MPSLTIARRSLDIKPKDLLFIVLFAAVIFVLGLLVSLLVWYCCKRIWGWNQPPEGQMYDTTPFVLYPQLYLVPRPQSTETAENEITPPPNAHIQGEEKGVPLLYGSHEVTPVIVLYPPSDTKRHDNQT